MAKRAAAAKAMAAGATYSIGAVARLTGISAHALRAWERRYGLEATARSEGGSRRYNDADVERLLWIRELSAYGHALGDLARLAAPDLKRLVDDRAAAAHGPGGQSARGALAHASALRKDFLEALAAMDLQTSERVLARAFAVFDANSAVVEVVVPLLEEIGTAWERGRLSIAHEHAASAIVRSHLGSLLRVQPDGINEPVVVCATLAGELHEFGALCAATVAATAGWRTLYLGPSLPANEIAAAARKAGAGAVLVSAIALATDEVRRELALLRGRLGRGVALLAGGRAAELAAPLPDRVAGPISLGTLATRLQAL